MDVRNRYETALGVFKSAVDPAIDRFSELPEFLSGWDAPREKPLLMYCTGGIRCEKAYFEAKRAGFQEVYQLHGGILKYLEELPRKGFEGECFVFDHRVAVTQELEPSPTYKLCPLCGDPGATPLTCSRCSEEAVLCERCAMYGACSKDCKHHILRSEAKSRGC